MQVEHNKDAHCIGFSSLPAALKWEHFNKFDSDSPFKEVNKSNPVEWAKSINEILLRFEGTPGPSSESEGGGPSSVEPVASIQKEKSSRKRESGEDSASNLSSIEPIHCGKKVKYGKNTESKAEDPGGKSEIQESCERGRVGKKQSKYCITHTTF